MNLLKLYGAYATLLFLVILSTNHRCSARKNNNQWNHNIWYPFWLNTDPRSCGHKINMNLLVKKNRPTLYLKKVKYYFEAIEYSNTTKKRGCLQRLKSVANFATEFCLATDFPLLNKFRTKKKTWVATDLPLQI